MEALKVGGKERTVGVPMRLVIEAVERKHRYKTDPIVESLENDTEEEVAEMDKKIAKQKDLERKVEHGFVYTMIEDEMSGAPDN
jgi:hypothetical protein